MAHEYIERSNELHSTLSKTYGFDLDNHFPARTRLSLLLEHCNTESDVLDVGCANGLYDIRISPYVKSVTAIDISQDMLDVGKSAAQEANAENITFILKDGANFDFEGKQFDVIFCFASLVMFPGIDGFLSSARKNLKPGGTLIIDVLNRQNLSYPYWSKWYKKQGFKNYNVFTKAEIQKKLEEHGFTTKHWVHQGFAEQWKYIPLITRISGRLSWMNKIVHWGPNFDLDYILSNAWPLTHLTNRWYIVCGKSS